MTSDMESSGYSNPVAMSREHKMLTSSVVLVLPPRESLSRNVRVLSRNGMCVRFESVRAVRETKQMKLVNNSSSDVEWLVNLALPGVLTVDAVTECTQTLIDFLRRRDDGDRAADA